MALSQDTTEALITFLLGGGVITLVTQGIRASRLWRSGRLATTREVIRDIAAARDEAEEREADLRRDKDYWRGVAGDYGFQLRAAGLVPHPAEPKSPSEVRRDEARAAGRDALLRKRRADAAPTTGEIERIMGLDQSGDH